MAKQEFKRHAETKELLIRVAKKYGLKKLEAIVADDNSLLFEKDVYICLQNIVEASMSEGDVLEALKGAKNLYNSPVFAVNAQKGVFLIKNAPDFKRADEDLAKFSNCFKLSPYSIVNTYLALIEAQITGFDLNVLYKKGVSHIEGLINDAVAKNPNWNSRTLYGKNPVLVIPIGAAGTGKSTFYRELSNVLNISCDNVRYLLFKDFGPCFSSWESCLAWWTVNQLTDNYISKGCSVFYNGVNTDMEYRSPITMENTNPLYAGMPYNIKLVYFEPPAKLTAEELKELKSINLWANPVDKVDFTALSPNVAKIMELIKSNFERTLSRTKAISEGTKQQDPYDILYSVPAAIVKLFVEQSFDKPAASNVVVVPRKEIPDEKERAAFYRDYANKVASAA